MRIRKMLSKKTLHWSYLNFKEIPMDLFLYENLEELYLKENFIISIPKWLMNMTTLRFLHLAGNNITELPEELYLLENVNFLDVSENQLTVIPKSIGLVFTLQRLNISNNAISEIPASIGCLRALEELNISKNCLKNLPIQLCECLRLRELNLSDNVDIWRIPERIANLPALQSLSADRCSLAYLPLALSKFLTNLRIFHNTTLTHVPMIYEKFFQNFYDNRHKSTLPVLSLKRLLWVFEKNSNSRLILPIGTSRIFPVISKVNLVRLYDECLRVINNLNRLTPLYEKNKLQQQFNLPEEYMLDHICNGPIARCTLLKCSNPLFTSYYFMVVKRRGDTSFQLFTCNFCTSYCAKCWLQEYSKSYYQVDWEICD